MMITSSQVLPPRLLKHLFTFFDEEIRHEKIKLICKHWYKLCEELETHYSKWRTLCSLPQGERQLTAYNHPAIRGALVVDPYDGHLFLTPMSSLENGDFFYLNPSAEKPSWKRLPKIFKTGCLRSSGLYGKELGIIQSDYNEEIRKIAYNFKLVSGDDPQPLIDISLGTSTFIPKQEHSQRYVAIVSERKVILIDKISKSAESHHVPELRESPGPIRLVGIEDDQAQCSFRTFSHTFHVALGRESSEVIATFDPAGTTVTPGAVPTAPIKVQKMALEAMVHEDKKVSIQWRGRHLVEPPLKLDVGHIIKNMAFSNDMKYFFCCDNYGQLWQFTPLLTVKILELKN